MDSATAKKILRQKEPAELYEVVQPALADAALRDELVEGSFDKNETYRYNCVRVLYRALEAEPRLFYGYWDRFAAAIDSSNGFHRSIGAQAVALLSAVDMKKRLDRVFDRFLGLLDDSKVMVSHYFLETLHLVFAARPDLQKRIVACLFSIEKTSHPSGRKDLLKADVIFVFDRIFETLSPKDRKRALAFAAAQETCSSGKTRKAAQKFVRERS